MLNIQGLSVNYGLIQVLKSININVNDGEIVTVIGPNGAGKTTLMKTIVGLKEAKAGKIEFNSKELLGMPTYMIVRDGIVLIPEGRWIFGGMTVCDNILMGAYSVKGKKHSGSTDFIYKIFPKLEERKNQIAETLSGGEQQMLSIARGMMAKPDLLLLDEPSLGLAPIVLRDVYRAIKEIYNSTKITILLVEQNVKYALSVAQRGYIIENGNIVLEGATDDLKQNPHVKKAYLGL